MKITLEIFKNGIKCWYKDGAYHRDGEHPAVIYQEEVCEYHIDGKLLKLVRPDGTTILDRTNEALDRR